MNYSIVIPVFNREDLTRNCLASLRLTLEGAGDGEIIVVDNGSRNATAAVLAEFPCVRVIRNDRNLGFAAACNQGARAATGRYLVHLNNDTVGVSGWLQALLGRFIEPGVGIAGARLLFPNDTIQHAGVMFSPFRLGPEGFGPFHFLWGNPGNIDAALRPRDYEAVTGACLATPRELFLELGGFDEAFWNGYEDVDYCLKVRARGMRVVYEPTATLYHFESQSGVQRKRRLMHNVRELADRWASTVVPDSNRTADLTQQVRREQFIHRQRSFYVSPLPATTVVVHGDAPADVAGLLARIRSGRLAPRTIVWAAAGVPPAGTIATASGLQAAIDATELRADRYVAFIDTRTDLEPDWLLELVDTVEFARDIAAATALAPADENAWSPLSADGGCTIVKMAAIPQHLRIDPAFATVSGGVADWLARAFAIGRSIRRTHRPTARVPVAPFDATYQRRYGCTIADGVRPDPVRMEALSALPSTNPVLTSIVMLSWNAPDFTELAVKSIREHTSGPYEIIIIDNGSGPETLKKLDALRDVRIIYNRTNMGFAHGCNQGLAAALGRYIVLLNNDVVVTDGWLDALLAAHRMDPAVGISAPRSNYVAGHQQLHDSAYADMEAMHAYARERRERLSGRLYHADRVIGFCMCISRDVIDEIGGIDPRYGIGNFEDDDFCVRVRAAGYEIAVCEDSFIHHFGNVTFRANNVDWSSQMQANWSVFADRWQLPPTYPTMGYDPRPAIARGFDRARDFVPLPRPDQAVECIGETVENERSYAIALLAIVRNESDWSRVAPVVTNYVRALSSDEPIVFAIAAAGELDAVTLGKRVERAVAKAGVELRTCPDIDVGDALDTAAWRERYADARCLAVTPDVELGGVDALSDRSRSGLARLARTLVAS